MNPRSTTLAAALAVLLAAPFAARAAGEPTLDMVLRAAAEPEPSHLQSLLAAGGPANGPGVHGETPLQEAVVHGSTKNVALLLERGAAIDAVASGGETALGSAARSGRANIVRQLLDAGAAVDAGADAAHAPVVLAAGGGEHDIAVLLFERGSRGATSTELAAALVAALEDANDIAVAADVTARVAELAPASPAVAAAAAGAIAGANEAVSLTIHRGLGPFGRTPAFAQSLLFAASIRSRAAVAATALGLGADPNARDAEGRTPLALAAASGKAGVVALLLARGADPVAAGLDPGHLDPAVAAAIAENRTLALAKRLGAFDLRDARGDTLLTAAARSGDEARVSDLLAKGANPSLAARGRRDGGAWTPLMIAAAEGHASIVGRLLAAGAAVDQRNAEGRTALAFAAWYGRSAVVRALLGAGADPDRVDAGGLTAQQLAEAQGDQATIDVLEYHAAAAAEAR